METLSENVLDEKAMKKSIEGFQQRLGFTVYHPRVGHVTPWCMLDGTLKPVYIIEKAKIKESCNYQIVFFVFLI